MTRSKTLAVVLAVATVAFVGCGENDGDEPVRETAPTSTAPQDTPVSTGLEDSTDENPDTQGAEPGRKGSAADPPGGSTPGQGGDADGDGQRDSDGNQEDVNPETLRD